jgi:alpha-glucosidase
MNGSEARTVEISLSFIGTTQREAMLVNDRLDDPAAVEIEHRRVKKAESLKIAMRAGGGFVGRFVS